MTPTHTATPVAEVLAGRREPIDDASGAVAATVRFDSEQFTAHALPGLEHHGGVLVPSAATATP